MFPAVDVDMSEEEYTATISSDCEADYAGLEHLPPHEVDAQLFWAYEKARRNWRNHMRRPTRRTRRFARRKGKGKGRRGKGKSKFSFFEEMTDYEYTEAFYGGKGRCKAGQHQQ